MSGKESKSKSKEASAGKKMSIIGLGTWEKHVALSDEYRAAQSRERKKKGLDKLALGKDVDPNMPKSTIRKFSRKSGFERMSAKAQALLDGKRKKTLTVEDVKFLQRQSGPSGNQVYGSGEPVPRRTHRPKVAKAGDEKTKKAVDPEYKPEEEEQEEEQEIKKGAPKKKGGKAKAKKASGKTKGTKRGREEKETEDQQNDEAPQPKKRTRREKPDSEVKEDQVEAETQAAAADGAAMDTTGDGSVAVSHSKTPSKPAAPADSQEAIAVSD